MKFLTNKLGLSFVSIFLIIFDQSLLASEISPFPDSTLVHESSLGDIEFNVILSAPKRINNALEIEKQETVKGNAIVRMYELKSGAQLENAYKYYQGVLSSNGDIQFQCEKRACGVSNYWANKIFDEHKLYGRDSSQYYIASVENSATSEVWRAIYIVQNGLRKKYVYELSINSNVVATDRSGKPGVWVNGSAISADELSAAYLKKVGYYVRSAGVNELFIVVYANRATEPTKAHWDQLQAKANSLVDRLRQNTMVRDLSIRVKLLGPLHNEASFENQPVWFRLYLF